jgi:PKHD-type hydroxylase
MSNYVFAPAPNFGVSEHPFVTWENAFTDEELDKLVAYADQLPKNPAVVGSVDGVTAAPEIRISNVAWVHMLPGTQWIYDRLAFIARQLNGQFYQFDLYGFSEDLQYTVYDGETDGHYTWHIDSGVSEMAPRKLSFVLQLSDPSDYEGGDLEVYSSAEPSKITKQRGLIAAFPSYRLHRVTPVTSGIRKTLVVWACGPSFK